MSAIIRNLSFDKDYYKRGDKAVLSMVWLATPPSASFPRGGKVGVTSTTLNLSGTITNVDGHQCASPIEQKLTIDNKNPKVEIPVSITSKCINPKVALMIKDAEGNTLDQKEFNIKTTSMPERKSVNPKTILWIVIAIAIVVSGSIYMKKKKKTGTDINS
jgi:hypothetical protein